MTKLAFWRVVGGAYAFTFGDPRRLARAAGGWIIGLSALALPAQWLLPKGSLLAGLAALADALLYVVGLAVFAAKWHRAMLLNESVSGSDALRIGRRELRYLGYALLVVVLLGGILFAAGMVVFLPLGVLLGSARGGALGTAGFYLCEAAIAVALGAVVARLALALPAAALEEAGDVLETAWQRSRGNGVRLCLGAALCLLPFILVQHALAVAFGGALWLVGRHGLFAAAVSYSAAQLVLAALVVTLYFAAVAVTAAFFSLAYRQLASAAAARDGMAPEAALPAM